MSSVSSPYSSDSRITGLFSNLDTDSIVESMCSGQQAKIDNAEQKKTSYEWYTEALEDVLSSVKDFSNTYCSSIGASSMLKASTYYSYSITSSSTGNAVSLTSSTQAQLGDYSVMVSQLAENANISSSGRVSADGVEISSGNTATLAGLSFANPLAFDDDGNIAFAINGAEFSFSKDTTLQSMINTVNGDSDANVTMKYSRLTDTFTVTADSGGEDSSVSIRNISGNAFGENSAFMIDETTIRNGCDSIAEINGVTVTRDSNEYAIDGITFELNKVTAGTDEDHIDFTVERDYSATVSAVSAFIDGFNSLITELTALTSADDNSYDYPPLTDTQKEEMSEDEIAAWEEKAKSGILHSDPDIEKLVSNLKNAFFSAAGGTGKTAASIGISSGSYYDTDKGLIVLDTDELTSALESDPETVIAMFSGGSSSSDSSAQGIMYKLRSALSNYKDTADDSISGTGDKIDDTEATIDSLTDRLDSLADQYYEKFSAMETALAKLNSQSSYISQLFS